MITSDNPSPGAPVQSAAPATAKSVATPAQSTIDLTEELPSIQRLLTKKEIAKYHKVNPRTIDQWMKDGRIPFRKIGGAVRFNLAEVEEHHREKHLINRRSAKGVGR